MIETEKFPAFLCQSEKVIESKSDVELGNYDGSFAGKHLTKQAFRETERMLEPDREKQGGAWEALHPV